MNNEARTQVARWPLKWRARWGERANELEHAGLGWHRAEAKAYQQVCVERKALGDYSTVELEPEAELPDFDKLVPDGRVPKRWECERPLCAKGGWWLSRQGALGCLSCCPPHPLAQVAKRGTVDQAPLVDPDRSTTPLGTRCDREHMAPAKRPARRKVVSKS